MKPTPEEFVTTFLAHSIQPYDPQEAHEYYLRNRELLGRRVMTPASPIPKSKSSAAIKPLTSKKIGKASVLIAAKRQQAVNGRVAGLQKRLTELVSLLKNLMAKSKTKEDSKKGPDKKSDQTSKEKQAAAKSSEKFYEKNKIEIAAKAKADNKANPDADMSIKEVEALITKIRVQIKTAIAQARQVTKKKGV